MKFDDEEYKQEAMYCQMGITRTEKLFICADEAARTYHHEFKILQAGAERLAEENKKLKEALEWIRDYPKSFTNASNTSDYNFRIQMEDHAREALERKK